jgi:hypothetical protein
VSRSVFLYYENTAAHHRDEVEDFIVEAVGDQGSVTGGGAGLGLVNLDVELTGRDPEAALRAVDRAVAQLSLPGAFWQWEHDQTKIPVGSL